MTTDLIDKVFVFKGSAKRCGDVNEPERVEPVTKHLSISTRQLVVKDNESATVLYIFDVTAHELKVRPLASQQTQSSLSVNQQRLDDDSPLS